MTPDAKTLNQVTRLVWRLSRLVGKSCVDVAKAVLYTRDLKYLGQDGNGRLTDEQAKKAIVLLEIWIDQAKEGKRNGRR